MYHARHRSTHVDPQHVQLEDYILQDESKNATFHCAAGLTSVTPRVNERALRLMPGIFGVHMTACRKFRNTRRGSLFQQLSAGYKVIPRLQDQFVALRCMKYLGRYVSCRGSSYYASGQLTSQICYRYRWYVVCLILSLFEASGCLVYIVDCS